MYKFAYKMQWIYIILVFVPVNSYYANSTGTAENLINTPCTDRNHFFLAPGVLTAGGTNRACISRFFPEGPARMLLSLMSEDKQTVTASRELPPGDGGCLDISVPLLPNTKAELVVNIWYPEVKCSWERRVTLRISSGRVLVVHTERARYRPGETLRVRVFALKADLTPSPGNIEEIWLEGPPGAWEGTRVAQWNKVRSKMGLAQIQHDIDELAPPGRWTVRAKLTDGSQGSAVFWVGNYELPPFQLTVRHAPRVLRTSERLVWTVCVRYPWTEAVEGMLVIRLRGAGSDSSGIRTAVRLRAPRACHRHAAAARRVGLGGEHPPDVVVADFSFQEEGTRIWQNTTVVSQVVDKAVTLEFITKYHSTISPGLPYKLKVKATRWDDKPAQNERIRVCRYTSRDDQVAETSNPICISGDTDTSGVAKVMFPAEDDGSPNYRFEASIANDSSISAPSVVLRARRSSAALGPLRGEASGTRTFVPLYLTARHGTQPLTVHFVVITRGGIIYRWGATTQCPIASSDNHIQTTSRNSKCNDPMPQYNDDSKNFSHKNNINNFEDDNTDNYINKGINANIKRNDKINYKTARDYDAKTNRYIENSSYIIRNMNQNDKNNYLHKNIESSDKNHSIYDRFSAVYVKPVFNKLNERNNLLNEVNVSDSLLDRNLLRVMLPIKVTQQMCPDSHMIAYFYYNGEFVSATKHFEMDDCFVNKVEASFLSRQALPGSQTTLQITTPGPALCALTALDSAAKWNSHTSVKDVLMKELRRMIDSHRNVTEYDDAGDCFYSAESYQAPNNSLEETATWLAAAGVRTVTNINKKNCDSPASLIDEGTVPRSDFSEAWLWRLVTVGANGSVLTTAKAPDSITRYEANAVCLSKTGVAVSQPAVLQVFREFFIHADSPKRLRRGDSTIIRYRIFNYLYEPLSVQIQIITTPHLQGPPEVVQSICVPPRASAPRRGALTATAVGEGALVLRAKAVDDGTCRNTTLKKAVSDEVVIKIKVEPEGVPIQEHKSMMLCDKENTSTTESEVMWSWPPVAAIPGTESLMVWTSGDIVGPLLADADSLILLPRGCGEQNMARTAANLLALLHLDPHSAAALTAKQHVARGFTRQLQYIHPSGGFSAFGASDATASTWLTAFSLRYLRKAHNLLWPDLPMPPAIEKAEQWLLNQQMENGCFRNEGQVFHRELRGGINEEGELASVALTAYVITSLVEGPARSVSSVPVRALRSTLSCVRALPAAQHAAPARARVYVHALLAYALMSLDRYEQDLRRTNEAKYEDLRRTGKVKPENLRNDEASWLKGGLKENESLLEVMQLIKLARRDGEYLWWETESVSTSIEATSYALLALRQSPTALREYGAPAIKWLATHRGPSGGFISTQDTLVALEALTAWSSLQTSPANLTVTVTSGAVSNSVYLDPGVHIPEILQMPPGDTLKINVQGSGCALVQATRRYHAAAERPRAGRLSVHVAVLTDGTFDCDAASNYCFCAATIQACAVWSGSFPEMALMEITLPGGYGADTSKLYAQLHKPDTLVRRIEVSGSGSRVSAYLSGVGGAGGGHGCVAVAGVGPRRPTRAAYVRLLDYYNTDLNDTQVYTIPEDCPSRVTHESSQDLTSDNLYNEARSQSNSGEILITQEFTFEDIPEGIPLDDPLYENLTKEKGDLRAIGNENYLKLNQGTGLVLEDILPNMHWSNTNMHKTNILERRNEAKSFVSKDDLSNIPRSHVNLPKRNLFERIGKSNIRDKVNINDKLDLDAGDRPVYSTNVYRNAFNTFKPSFESDGKHLENLKHEVNDKLKMAHDGPNTFIDNSRSITAQLVTESNLQTEKSIVNEITENTNPNHRIEIRDEHESHKDNPSLVDFHVIDSEKDLEVPSGIEGPIPVMILPPDGFVPSQYLMPPKNVESAENLGTPQNMPKNFASQFTPNSFSNFGPPRSVPRNMHQYLRRRTKNILPSG